jgi:hypothetical protein
MQIQKALSSAPSYNQKIKIQKFLVLNDYIESELIHFQYKIHGNCILLHDLVQIKILRNASEILQQFMHSFHVYFLFCNRKLIPDDTFKS